MRTMRRSDRQLPLAEAQAILESGEYGVLSTVGSDGQPYGVPVNYVYTNDRIYFHCALTGHKLDNLADNPRVSFCVVGRTTVIPSQFATEYESVLVFGTAAEVQGAERHAALVGLLEKYCSGHRAVGERYIEQKNQVTTVIGITVDQISGKARR